MTHSAPLNVTSTSDDTADQTPSLFFDRRDFRSIEKRGGKRKFSFELVGFGTQYLWSRGYPSRGQLFQTQRGLNEVLQRWWRLVYERCSDTTVSSAPLNVQNLPPNTETEHPIDVRSPIRHLFGSCSPRIMAD